MKSSDKTQDIGKVEDLIGKSIVVKKFGYELRYTIKETRFVQAYGSEVLDGVITEVTGSCSYNVNDKFGITANELRSAKYMILSKSSHS